MSPRVAVFVLLAHIVRAVVAYSTEPPPASGGDTSETTRRAKSRLDELRRAAMNHGGDPANGNKLFASQNLKCETCHKVHGRGGDAGPDLSQVAGKLDRPQLIESLLDPSAQILEGFRTTLVTLDDGRELTGLVTAESSVGFTLVDANAKKTTLPHSKVAERKAGRLSIMPADPTASLSPEEFTDLVAYLETLRAGRAPTPGEGVTGAVTLPEGFAVDPIATGLSGCTAMEVAPDGRIFICEQTGALRIVKKGKLLAEPFVKLPVTATWERGLIGVTVAPDFPRTPHVFVCYVTDKPFVHHVVSRLTAHGDRAQSGSEVVLWQGDDQSKLGGDKPDGHQGGATHFGADGKLYIAIGEQTAATPSQSMNTFLGKLLRLNSDGSIPSDNPFVSTAAGKYRAIWALGLRNPYTFAVQPRTGRIFINDVGGKAEEINEGVARANYGWPEVEHGPTTDTRFRGPIHHYPTACISGGAFAPGELAWPAEYRGRYFFADFNHGVIRTIDPEKPAESKTFATGVRRPVDLRFGERTLYVLCRNAWVVDQYFQGETGSLLAIRFRSNDR